MRAFTLALIVLPAPLLAREPILNLPVECTLGETCYIQNFVDTDPGKGTADFLCGPLSYDGNIGTDFALPSTIDMWNGVRAVASAPGRVVGIRDGMIDHPQGLAESPDVTDQECGNGVIIDHGDGWSTQYCHLMKGSIAVEDGLRVAKGTPLGKIGLSGQTDYPHLHFVVRRDGKPVDPFNPDGLLECGPNVAARGSLWQTPVIYDPGGIVALGVTDAPPDFDMVKAGTAGQVSIAPDAVSLYAFVAAYGMRDGDIMRISLAGPEGEILSDDTEVHGPYPQYFAYSGRDQDGEWATGGYIAMAQLLRDGAIVDQATHHIRVGN